MKIYTFRIEEGLYKNIKDTTREKGLQLSFFRDYIISQFQKGVENGISEQERKVIDTLFLMRNFKSKNGDVNHTLLKKNITGEIPQGHLLLVTLKVEDELLKKISEVINQGTEGKGRLATYCKCLCEKYIDKLNEIKA